MNGQGVGNSRLVTPDQIKSGLCRCLVIRTGGFMQLTSLLCILVIFNLVILPEKANAGKVALRPLGDICLLAKKQKRINGSHVNLTSLYTTDLRHGAFLTSERCPGVSFERIDNVGLDDQSVVRFDNTVNKDFLNNKALKYRVNVVGKLVWVGRNNLHGVTSLDPVPAHGAIVFERVLSFTEIGGRRKLRDVPINQP